MIRAELLKLRSIPTGFALLAAMSALCVFAVLLHGLSLPARQLASRDDQLGYVFRWGELFGPLFAGMLGALLVAGEYRYGTIRPTFLMTPRRERVLLAKAAVAFPVGLVFGLVATGIVAALGAIELSARGLDLQVGMARYLLGGTAAAGLWALLGVGLGALVRAQVPVIVGLLVWLLFVENVLVGFLPGVGRWLPGAAGGALAGIDRSALFTPFPGALLLVAYTALFGAAGWIAMTRHDAT